MLGVIFAVLIAAASPSPLPSASPSPPASPLPFTPPAGWTQLPSRAMRTQTKNVWVGPKAAGGVQASFSQAVMPMPMPLTPESKGAKRIALCGVPAQMSTVTAGEKSARMTMETVMSSRGGYTYITAYARPASSKADSRIQALLHGFCPPKNGELADLTPPAGWTEKPAFDMNGVWMGPAPMQMLMLATGPQMKSLADVVKSAPGPMKQQNMKFGKSKVSIDTRPATLCGLPALFVTMRSKGSDFPFGFDGAVTQNAKASYVLLYMHPGAQTPLPEAMAALKSLCASPAPATPAPSPVPSAAP